MEMQELEITIDPESKVFVRVKGAKGKSCIELSKPLEEALGTVESRTYTAEYYEPSDTRIKYREK